MTQVRELIRDGASGPEARRQGVGEALSAAVEIANRTLRDIAVRRRSGRIDLDEERALAQGWQNAGLKLLNLPEAPTDLVNRYFLKAEYWSDPEAWTEHCIDSSKIHLDEISRESREQLLGLRPSQLSQWWLSSSSLNRLTTFHETVSGSLITSPDVSTHLRPG
jgi:hypothetical protein